jgi:Na+/H+ antiporter NhaC
VIVVIYLIVAVISVAAGLIADSLGTAGRALVQWAVDSVIAPVPALGASVLYFALLGDRNRTAVRDEAGSAPPTA